MTKIFKPFLFIKTVVAWGTDVEDALDRLYNDTNSELISDGDWVCDEVQSEDEAWVELMGGEIEEDDDEDFPERAN